MCAAAILSILGGVCEFVGLLIVAVGILRDRQRARDLFARRRPPEPRRRQYPPRQFPRPTVGLASTTHSPHASAASIANLEASAANAFIGMRKALDKELDQAVDALRKETTEADNELRGHLRYVLAGSIRDRAIGAGFLFVGIVLTTLGSVV